MEGSNDTDARLREIFERVTDPSEIRILIKRGADNYAKVTLWKKNQSPLLNARLSDRADPRDRIIVDLPPGTDLAPIRQDFPIGETTYINVFVRNQAVICVETQLLSISGLEMVFAPPQVIFKAQRRRNPRFPIPSGYEISVKFLYVKPESPDEFGVIESKRILDISTGGLSFVTSVLDRDRFTRGTELRAIEFTIRGRTFRPKAVVAHAREASDPPQPPYLKIGVQFLEIEEEDQQQILYYISENLAQYGQGKFSWSTRNG